MGDLLAVDLHVSIPGSGAVKPSELAAVNVSSPFGTWTARPGTVVQARPPSAERRTVK